jgi:U3 small nucleolar RNA-associated protein 25
MQNMEHLLHVIDQSNLPPGKNHDTDFGRVRPYFLENRACEHRQLILTTAWAHPLISSLFRRGKSLAGALRVHVSTDFGYDSDMHGCMLDLVLPKCNQIFQKIPCTDPKDQYDLKYDYFKGDILSQIQRLEQKYTLIVAPSYLDYVRIRNLLIETEANAAFICEYSRDSEISRSRSRFFHGIKDILLYSGRCHFFRRYLIRGARHIIFYSLPEYAHFYPELVNPLGEHEASEPISCTVLFTRYELAALQRLVGPQRAKQMLASAKNTFLFNSS